MRITKNQGLHCHAITLGSEESILIMFHRIEAERVGLPKVHSYCFNAAEKFDQSVLLNNLEKCLHLARALKSIGKVP
jgi:hypothetical protein